MTLEEIKNYLSIYDDMEDDYIQELIDFSEDYVDSLCGEFYKLNSRGIRLSNILRKKIIADLYENKGTGCSIQYKKDVIADSLILKLSLFTEEDKDIEDGANND